VSLSLLSMNGWAAVESDLTDHLASKFQEADQVAGLVCANTSQDQDTGADSSIEYKQFFIGFVPSATFGINSVLSLQISPEITFTYEKTELPN
jgi:hypothetical protein